MNVTADLDGRFEFEQDGLADKDFASAGAEVLDFVFLQLDRFAGSVAADYMLVGLRVGTSRQARFWKLDLGRWR